MWKKKRGWGVRESDKNGMTPNYLKVRVLKNEKKQEWNEKKEKNREKDIK